MTPYYSHGGIAIYHGDCFDVLPFLSGIGAIVTDPPYSSGGQFRGDRMVQTSTKYVNSDTAAYRPEFAGDNRDQRSFLVWCSLWMMAARHASLNGAVLCSFADWRQLPTMTDAVQCGGWVWRNIATWWKPGIRMQRGQFSHSAEYVIYASNGPVKSDFDGAVQNVYRCGTVEEKKHIAEKPVDVMRWILSVVPPQSLVLDPFVGSGATLEAARALGHRCIGIDSDERYCEISALRLSQEVLPLTKAEPEPQQVGLLGAMA